MKGKKKLYLYPILAVFFFVQLTGLFLPTEARTSSGISTGIAAQGGNGSSSLYNPFGTSRHPRGMAT